MKRRATIVAATVAILSIGGLSVAEAAGPASIARDTSGCIVVFPDAPNPLTICLFPR